MIDYILNGQGFGGVAATLLNHNMDPGVLRPFIGRDGRSYVTINDGFTPDGKPKTRTLVCNTPATLRKDDWILLDEAIIKAAQPSLRCWADLRAASSYVIPDGMGVTVLQSENVGDINGAEISMDGLRQSNNDRPHFDLVGLPLPIIHKDFQMSARQLATSRRGGSPLDTTMGELAGRKVAEEIERLTLGTGAVFAFGGYSVYGYTNFPSRMTKTLTLPTAAGWTPAKLVQEVMEMKLQSQQAFHNGPWMLYNSIAWDTYLDSDYSAAKGDHTLRDRLLRIDGIRGIRTLDAFNGYNAAGYSTTPTYQLILVQQTSNVARAVVGMEFHTLQWESHGGMQLNFKVLGIMVPQLRTDQNSRTGIVHGTAA